MLFILQRGYCYVDYGKKNYQCIEVFSSFLKFVCLDLENEFDDKEFYFLVIIIEEY